jgi:hypothetical protein
MRELVRGKLVEKPRLTHSRLADQHRDDRTITPYT